VLVHSVRNGTHGRFVRQGLPISIILSAEYLVYLIRLLDIQPPASGGGRSGRLDRRAY
jgi:hypothetical protein